MARAPGISKSTFYRQWREDRLQLQDGRHMHPPVLFDLSHPGVIRREQLEEILAAEKAAETSAVLAITRPAEKPVYEHLRSIGLSDIRARREVAGLSLADVAAASGMKASWLTQIENGTRRATPEQTRLIENALARALP
jgi:ribosome-binding protein aMBF1 (putative translation factor)